MKPYGVKRVEVGDCMYSKKGCTCGNLKCALKVNKQKVKSRERRNNKVAYVVPMTKDEEVAYKERKKKRERSTPLSFRENVVKKIRLPFDIYEKK